MELEDEETRLVKRGDTWDTNNDNSKQLSWEKKMTISRET